jgi:hypothetical protein
MTLGGLTATAKRIGGRGIAQLPGKNSEQTGRRGELVKW